MHPIGAAALGGAKVLAIGASAALPGSLRTRSVALSGEPAADAAAILKQFQAAHGGRPRDVIVVASDAPRALQMPAAALSAESGAPILFVLHDSVPAATVAALKALRSPTIYVVAPTTLGKAAYAALKPLGSVVHVTGAAGAEEASGANENSDPVDNAISVSRFSHGSFGWGIHEAGHGLVFANVVAAARRARRCAAGRARRLRPAAAAEGQRLAPGGADALPLRHRARLHRGRSAGARGLQSRLADRRRTGDLGARAGRTRHRAGDRAAPALGGGTVRRQRRMKARR